MCIRRNISTAYCPPYAKWHKPPETGKGLCHFDLAFYYGIVRYFILNCCCSSFEKCSWFSTYCDSEP